MLAMATNRGNKPTRHANMYVYKMETISPKEEESVKKVISRGWGALTRSKTYREHKVVDGGGMVVEQRKSVSSAMAPVAHVEGRRSSVSAVELADGAAVAAKLHVKVLVTDMPGFMQVHAFRCARTIYDGMDKFGLKHMAHNIKKEFDKVYDPAWHCIVGSSFGSFVTHSTGCFLYFSMEKLYILIFKTKVRRALQS